MFSKEVLDSHKSPLNLRDLMAALQNKAYFNYGGQGPLPQSSLKAITKSWEKIQSLGPFTNNVWPYIADEIESTKILLSKICGVSKHRIALTENVTSGCVLPLWGLPLSKSHRILISDCEHPGVVAACKELAKRKDLSIDILHVQHLRVGLNEANRTTEFLLKEIDKSIHEKTKLVVLSHLLWNTGQIMPIEAIANKLKVHSLKPFLLVDAAQSFGQIPVSPAADLADIYAFTGHKWACGPEGLGAVVVSERVLKESTPTLIGWKSLEEEKGIYDDNLSPFHKDARRFEIATSCIPLLAGLRCSLELLEAEGSEKDRLKKIQNFSKLLWCSLNEIEGVETILKGPPPAGLVSFTPKTSQSPTFILRQLGRKNLFVRVLEDPPWLRACLHVTSIEKEIMDLAIALKELMSSTKSNNSHF
tara:strand:- start:21200 stop:22453 length:1254 start_codon:yes stop_codon:yes gene_type:complete